MADDIIGFNQYALKQLCLELARNMIACTNPKNDIFGAKTLKNSPPSASISLSKGDVRHEKFTTS